ncbi:hypothetical protein [Microbacterium sp. LWS13-1.2]|uniref:Uncharacterized protein n=1 Tax=Microbacterium sp. LWS13-1.2 TaxID=3135264 RepID=A0AAU6SB90_9MICO
MDMDPWLDAASELPLLLVPVRVETKSYWRDAPGGDVDLRVRIWPDDVATDPAGALRLLPDAFRVIVTQDGIESIAEGAPIDSAALGIPLGKIDQPPAEGETDAFDEGIASLRSLAEGTGGTALWLRDYQAAVGAGLAITVPLSAGTATIQRLVVIGLRRSDPLDPAAAAREVLAALQAHPDRALVAAGTPTNNTDAARSGWGTATAGDADPTTGGGAGTLARALGLEAGSFADWPGATAVDARASWMADALWPVTWGPWLSRAIRPRAIGPFDRLDVADHVRTFVRPAGPYPAVRVGRQPYGIVPVTLTSALASGVRGHALVQRAVRAAWPMWANAQPRTVRVGDLAETLPWILGLAPASRNVRVRRMLPTSGPLGAALSAGRFAADEADRDDVTRKLEEGMGLRPFTLQRVPHLGGPRMLALPLVADDDVPAIEALAQSPDAVCEGSVLQLLLSSAWAAAEADARFQLRQLLDSVGHGEPGELAPALRETLEPLRELVADQGAFDELLDAIFDPALFDVPAALDAETGARVIDLLRSRLGELVTSLAARTRVTARLRGVRQQFGAYTRALRALAQLVEYVVALAFAGRTRDSIRNLTTVDDSQVREQLLAGALDAASHRLDAWVTSLATRRLSEVRQGAPDGVTIGAFAWLEDIALTPRAADDVAAASGVGWIQAPTTAHAAAAAVLRGARLTHAPMDGPDSPLELDVSSTRMRQAVDIVRGMRAGQDLGALLGYRFERRLHETDASLNRFLLVLRAFAPLVVGRETPADGATPMSHTGAVVDGLGLLKRLDDPARRREILEPVLTAPQTYEGWRAPTLRAPGAPGVDDLDKVVACVDRLDQLADAVSDLLLAEGVHQLVSGNPARAAAAMNAVSGDTIPEEPQIPFAAPEQDGATYRLAVVGGATRAADDDDSGWVSGIRSGAHPFLELWCRGVLGPATRIAISVTGPAAQRTLARARVSALEFVMASDGSPQGLERFWARCRRGSAGLPEKPLTVRPAVLAASRITIAEAWQLAAAARAVLSSARGLAPDDLVGNGSTDPRHVVDGADLGARLETARRGIEGIADVPPGASTSALLRRADELAAIGIGDDVDAATIDPELLAGYVGGLAAVAQGRLAAADAAGAGAGAALGDIVGRLPVVQVLDPPAAPDAPAIVAALRPAATDAAVVRRWLARMSTVRPPVAAWATLAALRRASGSPAALRIALFGAERWAGDADLPDPNHAVTSVVVELLGPTSPPRGFSPGGALSGLVVDQWAEKRPALRRMEDDTRTALVTTGLAVHAQAPSARAPQALLLAVPPDEQGWSQERLLDLLDEVSSLVRMRVATPADIAEMGEILPAISLDHWSRVDAHTVDPRALLAVALSVPAFLKNE